MTAYKGRLAFDPDTEFHIDPEGKPVVTDDGGKTWRYAKDDDTSHNARYQKRLLVVDSTANAFAELAYQHGKDAAASMVEPHHFEVQPDDAHAGGVKFDPDDVAETITGHTEAWK